MTIANEWRWLALLWHVVLGVALLGLMAGWRPVRRWAGLLLALPLVCVSLLAFGHGNAFTGTLLLATALACGGAIAGATDAVQIARGWALVAGSLAIAFGWIYPHFVAVASPVEYLYATPLGLVPCPTLATVIGMTLVLRGLGCRWWSGILAAAGLFYGLFGALRLGVALDWGLVVAALALGVQTIAIMRQRDANR